jgi:DNA-3-methyladenine glycosylase
MQRTILPQTFYEQSTVAVAQRLLGKYLVLTDNQVTRIGIINETEAYPGLVDKASHSSRGVTPRVAHLFEKAGMSYVYMIYGMYYCFNVVTDTPESGGAVLIRSVIPLEGLTGKTSGPGLLCKSYGITKAHNKIPVTQPPLTIEQADNHIVSGYIAKPRVGVDYAGSDKDLLYNFQLQQSPA